MARGGPKLPPKNKHVENLFIPSRIPSVPPTGPHYQTTNDQGGAHYTSKHGHPLSTIPTGKYNFKGPRIQDRLALVMIVKNEEKRIDVTFDTLKNVCKTFVILDTGSTDRTMEVIRSYCNKHQITLHMTQKPFVNFEVSRNDSLDYADQVLKNHYFILMMDCNDELRNHDMITEYIENYGNGKEPTGFYLRQQWLTHRVDTYYNIRLVISHFGWRYKGVVHEYICRNPTGDQVGRDTERLEIVIFQDRTKDDDKSMRRFKRDKELLYGEYLRNPTEPRTLFYLAQTCGCLQQHQEAYQFYVLRAKQVGFIEEVFHSYFRLGQVADLLGHPWEECLGWYLKAYSHSKRVEPLVAIAEHYISVNAFGDKVPDWHLAYTFAQQAAELYFPHDQILFIDKDSYLYKRWHVLGICAYYVNHFKEGREACIRALMSNDQKVDMDNLMLYLAKEKELAQVAKGTAQLSVMDPYGAVTSNHALPFPEKEVGMSVGCMRTKEEVLRIAQEKMN